MVQRWRLFEPSESNGAPRPGERERERNLHGSNVAAGMKKISLSFLAQDEAI